MTEAKQKRQAEIPAAESEALREQRDRFLAFAFAASDLLLEIGDDSLVRYALGATNQLIGGSPQDLIGTGWLELFAPEDRPVLVAKIGKLTSGKRCGPILVTIVPGRRLAKAADSKARKLSSRGIKVIFNACRIPGREEVVYCTITVANAALAKQARAAAARTESGLLERKAFESAAIETLETTKALGQDVELTFIEFIDAELFRDRVGVDRWQAFCADAGAVMRDGAIDNDAAGAITEDRFGIVHEAGAAVGTEIRRQLQDLAQAFDPAGGGLDVEQATIEAGDGELTSEEAAQALVYAINKVASLGASKLTFSDLSGSFQEQVSETQERIAAFKAVVAENKFDFAFQPIVDLESREISHFEALARFAKGESPYQTIVFAEEVGLIQDFDLASSRRAITYLSQQSAGSPVKLAVNLSGQSLQNDAFVDALMALGKENSGLAGRLMFEATESSRIHDLDRVSRVFQALKQMGFSMCLDDFGAGAASFQYLRALEVDYVKIDGTYTRRLLSSDRDSLLIRNLCELCRDLKIKTIAEMIELEDQVTELSSLGVHMGQGYLLGKPAPQPVFSRPGGSRSRR
ncbi:EAL domain-containing protein [Pelagibius litoralis]|uniref:EAL domain-containing protein n=1 Tax=Pelagibius litoralis TaxID=374515 RepID=A0A967C3S4_9PROT|nr:EAL domain-containing protein [Pelagibius litoralis]NIA67959.1 EAL domain-containing protein [Pelagibius litoralis]